MSNTPVLGKGTKFKDYTGKFFGRLEVIEFSHWYTRPSGKTRCAMWKCKCSCGNTTTVRGSHLKNGSIISCGCAHIGRALGKSGTPIYNSYSCMMDRCNLESADSYDSYGANGIRVCDRWMEPSGKGFLNFLEDMGDRPTNTSLDRINNSLGYFKENCRWASPSLQVYNQKISSKNTSGKTGVCWDTRKSCWRAYIYKDKKCIRLGLYQNFEDAARAREAAEIEYYGYTKQ